MQLRIAEFFSWCILLLIMKSGLKFRSNLVGCASILLLRAIFSVECASNCAMSEGGKSADCSKRRLREIPQDLSAELSVLDLTGNPFTELREKSFKKYDRLTSLQLRSIKISLSQVDLYLFRPLHDLRILNLSGSLFTPLRSNDESRAYFYLPTNLKTLDISYLRLNDIDLSQLQNLKEFYASHNTLTEFPIIHELAPLTHVDLEDNYLDDLSLERLALHCKLQVLNVQLNVKARLLTSPARYCICYRANLWINSFKIKGEQLHCITPHHDDHCDDTFSEDTLSIYNECLRRYEKKKNYITILVIAAIMTALLGVALGGYFFHLYYLKKVHHHSEETQQENDGSGIKFGGSKSEPAELDTDEN